MPVVKTHFHALHLNSQSLSVVAIKLRPYTAVIEKLQTLKSRKSNYTAGEILQPMSLSVRRVNVQAKTQSRAQSGLAKSVSNQQLLILGLFLKNRRHPKQDTGGYFQFFPSDSGAFLQM